MGVRKQTIFTAMAIRWIIIAVFLLAQISKNAISEPSERIENIPHKSDEEGT